MINFYLLSLGCPRNLVDSETLLGLLEKKGHRITETPDSVDIAVVNTCGFIDAAKQESVDAILRLAELKKEGKIKKLVVSGCLPQRYPSELMSEIGEIDAVFGTADFIGIPDIADRLLSGERTARVAGEPAFLYDHTYRRKLLTSPHYAYVKIQEGCSNRCSYCVIPRLKGPRRSRAVPSVLEEIKALRDEHDIKEVILIGQDTTSFGLDRSGKSGLAELLLKVSAIMKCGWVRLLYAHPVHFTDELIGAIAGTDNICKYIDLPIQHINDRILRLMNRRATREDLISLIKKLRERIEGITLRTSVIVGFPGETGKEFGELLRFLEDTRFDRLGAFVYSREEGTPAAKFEGQVPEKEKKARFDAVMKLQREISGENNLKFFNKQLKVLIDEQDPFDTKVFVGRAQMDAPEVDGVVYASGNGLKVGDFANVRITGTTEYDLTGEAI